MSVVLVSVSFLLPPEPPDLILGYNILGTLLRPSKGTGGTTSEAKKVGSCCPALPWFLPSLLCSRLLSISPRDILRKAYETALILAPTFVDATLNLVRSIFRALCMFTPHALRATGWSVGGGRRVRQRSAYVNICPFPCQPSLVNHPLVRRCCQSGSASG